MGEELRDAKEFLDSAKDDKSKRQRTDNKDNQTFTLTNLGQNPPRLYPDLPTEKPQPGTQSYSLSNLGTKPLEFKIEGRGTYKMALCMYFESGKGCGKGDTCTYAHGAEELKQNIERQGGFNKSVMCKFFEQGSCRNGTACRFAHSTDEMKEAGPASGKGGTKKLPCKFFENGYCGRGDLCSFAHGEAVIQAAQAQDAEKTMDGLLHNEAQHLMGQSSSNEDRRGKGKGGGSFGMPLPVPPPPPLAPSTTAKRLNADAMAEIQALMCPANHNGLCGNGDQCNLAHSVEDVVAGLIACGVCTLHLVTECLSGSRCPYAHVSQDQKACIDSLRQNRRSMHESLTSVSDPSAQMLNALE